MPRSYLGERIGIPFVNNTDTVFSVANGKFVTVVFLIFGFISATISYFIKQIILSIQFFSYWPTSKIYKEKKKLFIHVFLGKFTRIRLHKSYVQITGNEYLEI